MQSTVEFSTTHIALTAIAVGVLAVPLCYWLNKPRSALTITAICLIAMAATVTERLCANLTQLNDDGIGWFSANDLLAPALTYILLSIYADLSPPSDPIRYGKVRVALTALAFAVNVVAI